ncbi:MAG: AAA family ATPase, partial [Candidatus Saccharimonadales bacterium]
EQDGVRVERNQLIDVLSQGERKALYILNIIFEVEARKDQGQETIVIVDDIADSFDYKNKYAIIEYLKDIAEYDSFFEIILTHNFDFFRTVQSRFVPYDNCLYVNRTDGSLVLEEAKHIKGPFQHFLDNVDTDDYFCLASVPFVRNILDYTKGMDSQEFQDLTAVLHVKSNSDSVTIGRFEDLLNGTFGERKTFSLSNKDKVLQELFVEKADELLASDRTMLLENKIILSVAIRIKAEKFMLSRIKDPTVIDRITKDQTHELFKIFTEENPKDIKSKLVLKKVNLITPQNIHLNSFMYEPILDMSDIELKNLYEEVSGLK